ncbi:uncharacterized protein LOC116248126 [Nymphaea colorata]|nr:uncharacterized protein LOC116248126 [Nymphaea colorata]
MASSTDEPSQPLLLHKNPPSEAPPVESRADEIDSSSNPYPPIAFNYGPRRFHDLPFLFLFIIFVLCTICFGIFCITNHNSNYSNVSSFAYDTNTSSCKVSSSLLVERGLWSWLNRSNVEANSFLKDLVWTLVITAVLSVPFLFGILLLLKNYAKQVVYASLPFFVLIPVFFNVFWFVACTVGENCRESFPLVYRILALLFVFLVIGVIVWIIVANWHRIELTVRILATSANALEHNKGLFVLLPSLTLALLIYFVPIVVFLIFARFNGKIEPQLSESSGDYSCVWKQDRWVPAYYALAILTMLWSIAVMIEAQVYIISGTVAQWYFAKDDSMMRRRIRNSFRNAFGPSFGTVCFSGLLIAAIRFVRAAVDSARREDSTGVVNLILRCCVNFLLSAIDFLNKFTIIFAAIAGESYCSSSRMTYELLRRNLLSAVVVETVSTRILLGITFVISAIYAIVVCAILRAVSDLGADVYLIAVFAWLLLFVVFSFFIHVLDNVIDTIYICFAIDRDKTEVCKPDVHEVYIQLPLTRSERLAHVTGSVV